MIFLDRIDAVPLAADNFSFEFRAWLAVLVDSLNSIVQTLEDNLIAPSYTTAQITVLAVNAQNGSIYYDITTHQLKAKVNDVIVVLA